MLGENATTTAETPWMIVPASTRGCSGSRLRMRGISSAATTAPAPMEASSSVKVPAAPNERYTGLVLLFSTATGEPLAIFPDGMVQPMRVAATTALGAKALSREDAPTAIGMLD